MKAKTSLVFLFLVVLIMASCESGPRVQMAPGFDRTPTPEQAQANVMGTPVPTRIPPTPTIIPLELDNKTYTDPSRTLSFYPPLGWELINETEGYVKFTRPDGAAWFEGAVESTGYTLSEEDYLTYVDNLLDSLYGSVQEYQLIERVELTDRLIISSSFMKADQQWYAMDFFLQRERAVYALSFQAHESVWNAYKDRFSLIINRVQTQTGYLKDNLLYIFRKPYTAPGDGFEIFFPLGWGLTRDEESYPDGVMEIISSPDGEANIDIIALNATQRLAETDIGQAGTAILKDLIDDDLRTISGDVLNDGRLRVNWRVDDTGETGQTYLWVNGNVMYVHTYRYSDDHTALYRGLLNGIESSLSFPEPEVVESEPGT